LILYGLVFFIGYLLANILSAWEHQRFVESVLASNGFMAVLRLGLADELDGLNGDLAGMVRPLEALGSKPEKPEEPLAEIRSQLVRAARRTAAIKAHYGNTSAEDDLLKRMIRDRLAKQERSLSPESTTPPSLLTKDVANPVDPGTTEKSSPAQPSKAQTGVGKTEAPDQGANPKR